MKCKFNSEKNELIRNSQFKSTSSVFLKTKSETFNHLLRTREPEICTVVREMSATPFVRHLLLTNIRCFFLK